MTHLWKFPLVVFALSFLVLWLSTLAGALLRNRRLKIGEEERQDLGVIVPASLTLLGIIVGFSFSMSTGRYDQRKNLEEAEANAIGTEYLRVDLLSSGDAGKIRTLLKSYLDHRLAFYESHDEGQLRQNDDDTALLQAELWAACVAPAAAQPTAVTAFVASGMNDVLNSQGYTLAAWRNTIPAPAWILMEAMAIFCSGLIGYSARQHRATGFQFLILPFLVSVSFFLIADIDSPRGGVVRVSPQNLVTLAQSLHGGEHSNMRKRD